MSLHTVSFGTGPEVLRRMARLALDIQASAPVDPNAPVGSRIDSSFSEALDSVMDIQASAPVDPNAPVGSRIDSSFSEALDSVSAALRALMDY